MSGTELPPEVLRVTIGGKAGGVDMAGVDTIIPDMSGRGAVIYNSTFPDGLNVEDCAVDLCGVWESWKQHMRNIEFMAVYGADEEEADE